MAEALKDTYEGEMAWIETFTGTHFFPYHDEPEFDIRDIAHALAQCTRYNGHGRFFYSVAEHSILVSNIMSANNMVGSPLEGLMHDATEAYLSDIPAPFKQFLPDWQAFDKQLEAKLRNWMGYFADERPESVKTADWIALFLEAKVLLPDQGKSFADPLNLRATALKLEEFHPIHGHTPEKAEKYFIEKWLRLGTLAKHGGVIV